MSKGDEARLRAKAQTSKKRKGPTSTARQHVEGQALPSSGEGPMRHSPLANSVRALIRNACAPRGTLEVQEHLTTAASMTSTSPTQACSTKVLLRACRADECEVSLQL